ncbi:hypothetical protein NP233_g1323 [Leucocoprinus birnbaumii]|uniref:AA9 family lytic polysaccharide monooxygenase n=1 Tax=Leucocoprinus birnbaumii TaxID=56174 RepID=A0AAD5W0R3_9AGAR|nr:hypothetical protein NP233_g1323 [Leucocoprinus birnbaumii]
MKFLASLAAIATVALYQVELAASHGGVIGYKISNTYYNGFSAYNTPVGQSSIQREWDTYDPITNPTDSLLACNHNGASLGSGQKTAAVTAGSQVTAYWNQWPHTIGPVMVYMASCNGACASANPASLSWFKIDQAGLISGTLPSGTWAMGQLVANNNSCSLPSTPPTNPNSTPECAHLTLSGSGKSSPSGSYLVKFPGAYKASDPGVTIDIYSQPTVTTYTIPGPAVWRG